MKYLVKWGLQLSGTPDGCWEGKGIVSVHFNKPDFKSKIGLSYTRDDVMSTGNER